MVRQAPIENGGAQRAALADETDVAGQSERFGEGRIQADVRKHDANTVWADDAHASALRQNLFFQLRAGGAALFEAGGDNHRAFHVGRGAFADNFRHGGRRRGDHGKIDILRHLANCRKRLLPENRFSFGINLENAVAKRSQIFHQGASDASPRFARADHRDRARVSKRQVPAPRFGRRSSRWLCFLHHERRLHSQFWDRDALVTAVRKLRSLQQSLPTFPFDGRAWRRAARLSKRSHFSKPTAK